MEQFFSQALETSGGIAYILLFFVIALSIIVAVHEYGHYIVGRWCGIKADVFSIGFGPVLFARTDKRGTVWQFAALPLGGYVKFKGDANAASVGAEEGLATAGDIAPRDTMLGAPLWARAATVAAGPIFNFILSFFIFAAIGLSNGRAAEPLAIGSMPDLPYDIELQEGDVLLEIGGQSIPELPEIMDFAGSLPAEPTVDYTVLRDGEQMVVQGPHPQFPRASGIQPRSAAFDVEMKEGDVILAVDGNPTYTFGQLIDEIRAADRRTVVVDVWRDGQVLEFTVAPRRVDVPLPGGGFETRYMIGVSGGLFFEPAREGIGLWEAVEIGAGQVWRVISTSLTGLWAMITGVISTCNITGPIGIAETSGAVASQGVDNYIWFVAMLSTAVGLLNLFPVPMLDGGHLVFHAYEAVRGRPPSDKALRVLMSVGIAMIGTLMIFAIFNDLFC